MQHMFIVTFSVCPDHVNIAATADQRGNGGHLAFGDGDWEWGGGEAVRAEVHRVHLYPGHRQQPHAITRVVLDRVREGAVTLAVYLQQEEEEEEVLEHTENVQIFATINFRYLNGFWLLFILTNHRHFPTTCISLVKLNLN